MSDITASGTGTSSRTRKQSDTLHPHYFNSFQNYTSGPKAKTVSSPSNNDYLPIPEAFKIRADTILSIINRILVERIEQITQYTSVLPQEFFQQDFNNDYQKYLIDRAMFKTITDAGVINWMTSMKPLYPVRTSGNGNCLLHAVLIAMVGTHDFNLNLRDRLRGFMTTNNVVLKASWKSERLKADKLYGIQSEEAKLNSEWNELCDLVRYENSDDGQTTSNLEFLESVHIFSVSNMLSRPIIIISEDVVRNKHGEAISVNDLYGIYLPTLCQSNYLIKEPIVLAYDQSHFCPLQTNDCLKVTSSNNCLPLYQSAEHARKQTLLPIRFLGNEISLEESYRLLSRYLNIKKLAFYPESNSKGITVFCAELGYKRFGTRDDFFILFYDYLKDFYEIQKRKLKEQEAAEEEERKHKYEQDYYYQNQSRTESPQRTVIKHEVSSSPPPPPPYPQVPPRKPTINERRPSYGEAVTNGNAYIPNYENNHYSNIQKPQNTTQLIELNPTYINNTVYTPRQQTVPVSIWDNPDDDLVHNGKPIGNNSANSRASDSRLKQEQHQQQLTRIPVHKTKTGLTSPNLIDFDQSTDRLRPCIVCKNYFYDLLATGLCRDCDYKKNTPVRQFVIRRAPPNFTYPSHNYPMSDFISVNPLHMKIRGPIKIACPHCKNMNLINTVDQKSRYTCSICGTYLPIP